ncbi:MAG TPA: 3-dehydroquinate synthase [Terriglobia bacterium]|nr:3-dehydroquinate synthase [Terriglobia bacterium]
MLVGPGLVADLETHLDRAGLSGPFLMVSQPRVLKALGGGLRKRFHLASIVDGERAKTLTTAARLLDEMARLRMTRQSTVVAVGGGVVGDIAGFAASIYMRGIAVVQVPTTLLAQVDSSIGGKTGVNHRVAKNLIGAFHQPRLVLADSGVLETLPNGEYSSGLYEALKYGIIGDADLFDRFVSEIDRIRQRDPASIEWLVGRCAAIKAEVIQSDEKESGRRRILNFGHTVGHALEAAASFRRIRHGEAVGYGMIAACRISAALGKMSASDADRAEAAIASIGRLPSLEGVGLRQTLQALQHDKKARDGAIHFVLPLGIGRVEITPDVPFELVRQTAHSIIDESKRKR